MLADEILCTELTTMIIIIGFRTAERGHDQFTACLDTCQVELIDDIGRIKHRTIGRDHPFLLLRAGDKEHKYP